MSLATLTEQTGQTYKEIVYALLVQITIGSRNPTIFEKINNNVFETLK